MSGEAECGHLPGLTPRSNFRDLLEITGENGCRPQESLAVEARHVELANSH
jgi:hypothetical protein